MAGEDNYGADATAGGEVVPLSEEAEVAADGAAVGSGANGGAHEPAEGETTRAGQEPGAPAGEGDQTAPASDRRSNAAAADRRSDDQAEVEPEHKVFVGGISWQLDDKDLAEVFEKYRPSGAQVMKDKFTHRSRGFGFVWFSSAEDKESAVAEMHKQVVNDREISVTVAIPQSQTAPGTPASALGGTGGRRGDRSYSRYSDRGRYGDRSGYDRGYDRGYGSRGYGGHGGYDRRDMGGYGDPYARSYDAYGGYDRGYDGYDRYGGGGYGRQPYGGGYGDRGYDDRYHGGYGGGYGDRGYGADRGYGSHRSYGHERDGPYSRR